MLLPLPWRQAFAQRCRLAKDRKLGQVFASRALSECAASLKVAPRVVLQQRIVPGQLYDNKLHNLRRGASLVDGVVLQPGQTFSFWHSIGQASRANGFVEGRNIIQGRLRKELGGGLCQLSGLLYHLALLGGLEMIERHPHSIDLYREEDRFASLGADATVVWGVKDLRWRNPFEFSIYLQYWEWKGELFAHLSGESVWTPKHVEFARETLLASKAGVQVRVATVIEGRVIALTDYLQKPGMALS